MNTLSDTDEGRARPSVWPVYVAAAAIGFFSLYCLTEASSSVREHSYDWLFLVWAAYGAFGGLAAWGVARLHLWGWWCAVVWTVVFMAVPAFGVWMMIECLRMVGAISRPWMPGLLYLPYCAVVALVVWPIVMRRRLFFPPKPAGEE